AASRKLIILVGNEKRVPALGSRGKLPVEVVPFALPLCQARLTEMALRPALYTEEDGRPWHTENGNFIRDCAVGAITGPSALEAQLRAIPGVVGTGLFLGMADVVLFGDEKRDFELTEEKTRTAL